LAKKKPDLEKRFYPQKKKKKRKEKEKRKKHAPGTFR
jgi:hypothetical protein